MTDVLLKVLVVGDCNCGKTSICMRYVSTLASRLTVSLRLAVSSRLGDSSSVRCWLAVKTTHPPLSSPRPARYTSQHYREEYKSTVGVDFNLKVVNIDGVNASVQLWDIAGQDRYISMARAYYQSSQGAIIVYDVTNTASFEHVTKWKREIDEKVQLPSGEPLPVVLVGNKCDLEPGFALPNMDAYTRKHGFIAHLQTSAKSNINVNECMETLIKNIMARGEVVSKQQALNEERDTISAQLSADAASNGKGCC